MQRNRKSAAIFIAREIYLVALFVGIYGLMYAPALGLITSGRYFGGSAGDAGIYIWLLKENASHVISWPTRGFDVGFFYPFGRALAYSDNFLLPSFLGKLLLLSGATLPTAYNLLHLIATTLNGLFAYHLGAFLTRDWRIGLFVGSSFMFTSFLVSHPGHLQLQFAFFLPAVLLSCFTYLQKPSAPRALWAGACIVGAFLSSVYYALFGVLIVGVFFFGVIVTRKRSAASSTIRFFALNLLWLPVLLPFVWPYLQVKEAFGPRRLIELEPFSADLASYLSAASTNRLWGSLTAPFAHYENHHFPGTVPLLAALVLIALSLGRTALQGTSRGVRWTIYIFALAFLLTLISSFAIFGLWTLLSSVIGLLALDHCKSRSEEQSDDRFPLLLLLLVFFLFASFGLAGPATIHLPTVPSLFRLMFEIVPGMESIRATGRVGIIVSLTILLLAALGLKQLSHHIPQPLQTPLLLAITAVTLFELRTDLFTLEAEAEPPGIYQTLAKLPDIPGNNAAIALPFGFIGNGGGARFANMQTQYMRWFQSVCSRPIVNGYSGKMPPYQQNLERLIDDFPGKRSLERLGSIVGLRYILFHPINQPDFDPIKFKERLTDAGQQLRLVSQDEEGNSLFEFNPTLSFRKQDLLLPPDTRHKRILSFRLLVPEELVGKLPRDLEIRTVTEIDSDGEEIKFSSRHRISQTGVHEISTEIPPSPNAIRRQRVQLQAIGLDRQEVLTVSGIAFLVR